MWPNRAWSRSFIVGLAPFLVGKYNMKQYIIIFIGFLCFVNYAFASNTNNQSEIDLKMHIIEQKINDFQNNITEQETTLQNSINKQNAFLENNIDRLDKNLDRWISILSVFLGLLSVYLVWKTEYSTNKLEKDVDRCRQIKNEIESYKIESQEKLNRIRNTDQKAQDILNKIKTNKLFFAYASSSTKQNQSTSDNKEISLLTKEINSSKTESQYTANDWLVKGINAQFNNQYEDACFYYKKASEINPNNDSKIYLNWGVALIQLYSSLNSLHSNKNFILKLFDKANSIQNGSADYNIACLYALLMDKENFLIYLKRAIEQTKGLSRNYIEAEADFSAFHSDPDFIKILDNYFSK